MKLVLAFVPCWLLFLLGDLLSKIEVRWDAAAGVLHPIVTRLILWADDLQERAGGKAPWFPLDWQPVDEWPDDSERA